MKNTAKPTQAKPAQYKPVASPSKFSKWIPSLIAILVFAIVAIVYFLPSLKGMVLSQSDITQFLGSAHEIMDYRAKYHSEPLWTNTNFGGMPAYPISVAYPSNLIQYLFVALLKWLPFPCGVFFLYCIGFYILLRVLDVNPWVSIVGSLAYGFSSYFFIILAVGHNSKADAIAFMAPVLAGVILAFKGKRLQGAVLTAIALALELYSDHPQITYYLFLMVVIYGLMEFIKVIIDYFKTKTGSLFSGYFKTVGVLCIAAFLAVGTDITNLWLTYDYGKYSTRGKSELSLNGENKTAGLTVNYATQWSYGQPETFSFLIPNYQGGGDVTTGTEILKNVAPDYQQYVSENFEPYWGDQPGTSGPVYAGAIICFFAFLGLFLIKGPLKWFVFFSTILSFLLSWGSNYQWFTEMFFEHFPGYNKFRSVSMILVMAELAIPLLAVLAIDNILKNKKFLEEKIPGGFQKIHRQKLIAAILTGIMGIIFGYAHSSLLSLIFVIAFLAISIDLVSSITSVKKLFYISLIFVGGFTALAYVMPRSFSSMEKTNELDSRIEQINREGKASQVQINKFRQELNQGLGALKEARTSVFRSDAARSTIFILFAAGLAFLYMKKIIDWKWFTAVLGVFIIADMFPLDKRYLNDQNFKQKHATNEEFQPSQADIDIKKDTSLDYRVINLSAPLDQDGLTPYFHKSLSGYSGAKMKRYDQLMTYHLERQNPNGEFRQLYEALQGKPAYLSVINMLNTKWAIVPVSKDQTIAMPVPGALGNAWFVDGYKKVDNADSEMVALYDFNPARTAIVDKRYNEYLKVSPFLTHDSTAGIKMTSYEPNDLNYISHSKTDRLAVFSEIYYPDGWQAYIDGQPVDHFEANYVLRAMVIPAGDHKVEFKFHPSHYFIGEKISLASSIILILGLCGFLYFQFGRKKEAVIPQPLKGE